MDAVLAEEAALVAEVAASEALVEAVVALLAASEAFVEAV